MQRRLMTFWKYPSACPMSVPLLCGRKVMSSRMMRRIWLRPFLGGINFSMWSLKSSTPTLSLLAIEAVASAHVHQQHHRQLTLLLEHLHVGMRQTGRHIPVDIAHVVAILVLTHLAEGHTTPLEGRVVLAAEHLLRQPPRLYLYLADLLYNLFIHLTN